MTMKTRNGLGKLPLTGAACIALFMSACSTTATGPVAQGAPITYKADQGQYQQASIATPYTAPALPEARPVPLTPRAEPLPPAVSAPAMPVTPAPRSSDFNQNTVDQALYAHQRIGKTYTIMGKSYTPKHEPAYDVVGTASWYGDKFHGKLTANGESYDMNGISAAHKTLPLNSMVYVTNVETGKGMYVRINDRGPFVGTRIIDLSRQTALKLGLFDSGLAEVRVQYAGPADPNAHNIDRGPKHVPVAPRQKPKSDDLVAETPQYQSLRDLGRAPASPAALQPAPQYQAPAPAPVQPFPVQPFTSQPNSVNPLIGLQPRHPVPTLPPATGVPGQDAPVTLTIKGRVHMAGTKNDGSQEEARFIPAVNYTELPADQK